MNEIFWIIEEKDLDEKEENESPNFLLDGKTFSIILAHKKYQSSPLIFKFQIKTDLYEYFYIIANIILHHPKGPSYDVIIPLRACFTHEKKEIKGTTNITKDQLKESDFMDHNQLILSISYNIAPLLDNSQSAIYKSFDLKVLFTKFNENKITDEERDFVYASVNEIIRSQKYLVKLKAPFIVVGSLNSKEQLDAIFYQYGKPQFSKYIFITNEYKNEELLKHLLFYKVLYPSNIYLIKAKSTEITDKKLKNILKNMPLAILLSNKIFISANGITFHNNLLKAIENEEPKNQVKKMTNLENLLFNSFPKEDVEWFSTLENENEKQQKIYYGRKAIQNFLNQTKLQLVISTGDSCRSSHPFGPNIPFIQLKENQISFINTNLEYTVQ